MSRPDVQPIARKPLTKLQFAQLAVEQNGKCANCGVKLKFEPHQIRDEHVISLFGGGSNDLSHRQLWCNECVKQKNADDAARHAKLKRLRGETGQQARRSRAKSQNKYRSIASRGFEKRYRKKMNGEVVRCD